MTTRQLKTWMGKFGEEWAARNQIDPESRVESFQLMVGDLNISTILEVGCAQGHNLAALAKVFPRCRPRGVEPNHQACQQAVAAGLSVREADCFRLPYPDQLFDLVLTCGVLMHVDLFDLKKAVIEIARVSRKYLLAVEYYAAQETSVPYRDHENLLFKRDYGQAFTGLGLRVARQGEFGPGSGFNGCSWWLCEKVV